jgi:hypothetical protein
MNSLRVDGLSVWSSYGTGKADYVMVLVIWSLPTPITLHALYGAPSTFINELSPHMMSQLPSYEESPLKEYLQFQPIFYKGHTR